MSAAPRPRVIITSNDAEIPEGGIGTQLTPDSPLYSTSSACGGPCSAPSKEQRSTSGNQSLATPSKSNWPFENCGDEDLVISETTIGQDPDSVFGVIGTDYDDDNTLVPGERGAIDLKLPPRPASPHRPTRVSSGLTPTRRRLSLQSALTRQGLERPSCELGIFPESVNFGRSTTLAQRDLRIFNRGPSTVESLEPIECRFSQIRASRNPSERGFTDQPRAQRQLYRHRCVSGDGGRSG